MPRDHDPAATLYDMLVAAERALLHTKGKTRAAYEQNAMLRDAVERCLEIVGEAVRRLPPAFRDAHPHVPWRAVSATRHILAHEYDAIDNDTVWRIVQDHLPPLIEQIRPLLPSEPSPGED